MNSEDYLKEVCICLVVVVGIMAVLALLPAWDLGGMKVKRVNIFSDVITEARLGDPFRKNTVCVGEDSIVEPGVVTVVDSIVRIDDFQPIRLWLVFTGFCPEPNGVNVR